MSQPVGKCSLCLSDNVALCDSHIVPKWAYKRIRANQPGANPNPIYVSAGRAVATSNQFSEHLLCGECEQKLGIADGYVAKLAYADGKPFPALAQVGLVVGTARSCSLARLGNLNAPMLAYFAASVVWRGHITATLPDCCLGPHAEAFRLYLLEQARFPAKSAVAACLLQNDEVDWKTAARTITMPLTQRKASHFTHEFMLCGFYFTLHTGLQSALSGSLTDTTPLIGLVTKQEFVRWIAAPIVNARNASDTHHR